MGMIMLNDESYGGGGGLMPIETTSNAYDALPQSEKEDTSKIYFLNDSMPSQVTIPFIATNFAYKVESSMSRSIVNDKIAWTWNGGSAIGGCDYYPIPIPKEASAIKVKLTTGNSYSTTDARFKIAIGVKAVYQTTQNVAPTDSDWLAVEIFNTRNTTAEITVDLSNVNVDSYLMTAVHGWTVTFDEIGYVIETDATNATEIKYKDVSYGKSIIGMTKADYDDLPSAKKNNGSVYFVSPNSYTYTTFMNGAIIVREDNNDATDKKMFFVGLQKDSNDISITDTDLLAYLSDVTNGYKKATYSYSDANNTRNGNIGFYNTGAGVKLRSWTTNWTGLIGGTFYGVIDLNIAADSVNVGSGQTNAYSEPYVSGEYAIYFMNNKFSSVIS